MSQGGGSKLPQFPVWHLWNLQKCLLALPRTLVHGPPAQEKEADDNTMSLEDRANLPHDLSPRARTVLLTSSHPLIICQFLPS